VTPHAGLAVLVPVALATGLLTAGTTAPTGARPGKPNVVFILADDLGWADLGCQGSGFYETPRIDRMAAEGLRLTDAYAAGPNCAPTRAALMSGLYGPRTGIYTVGSGARGDPDLRALEPVENRDELALEFTTLGERFKAAGYRTAHIGKWHLGGAGALPEEQGFDVNFGGDHHGHPASYFAPYGTEENRAPNIGGNRDGEYLTDRLTREAISILRDNAKAGAPFYLQLHHFAVHTPIQSKAEEQARFAHKPPVGGQGVAAYAGMIASLDQSVGAILDELLNLGIEKETLVIFSSDHGGLGGYRDAGVPGAPEVTSNAPLRGGKGMLYEGGVRVPWIARWPGVIGAGRESAVPITSVDLIPTLLEVCTGEVPAGLDTDGVSFAALLGERPPTAELTDRALFWHFPGYLESGPETWRTTPADAIRKGQWKLHEFFETGAVELYDLSQDIGERKDLAAAYPDLAARLRTELTDWRAAVSAPMPIPKPNPNQDPGSDEEDDFQFDDSDRQVEARFLAGPRAYDPSVIRIADDAFVAWLEYAAGVGDRIRVASVQETGLGSSGLLDLPAGRYARPTLHDNGDSLWISFEREDPRDGWQVCVQPAWATDPPLVVSAGFGPALHHRAIPDGKGGLWFTWQEGRAGDFHVFARHMAHAWSRDIGFTLEPGPLQEVAVIDRGEWHPCLARADDGALLFAWDAYDSGDFDVRARWRLPDGEWGAPFVVAGGPRFEGRVQAVPGPEGGVWLAWEEGGENWGKPFRGREGLWNNATDASGPVHRSRRLRLALTRRDAEDRPLLAAIEVPQPGFAAAATRDDRREGVSELGVFYERPELALDGRGRPWLVYRHFANHQIGSEETVRTHVEEGWRLYGRCLRGDGWSPLLRLDQPQRDGLQRLALAPTEAGVTAIWATGRTDRDVDARPIGIAFAELRAGRGLAPDDLPAGRPAAPVVAPAPVDRSRPAADGMQLFFGDLHRHTDLSLCFPFFDGSLDDAYRYAIEVAELDFLGITDHTRDIDRGQVQSLLWWRATKEVTRHRLADRFWPYFAYERSRGDTDHNVISLRDDMLRPFQPPLPEFWAEIDHDTFTIPHNPFLAGVWDHHDDAKRPLLEIYQGFRDQPEYAPPHVHDGLAHGYHFGFVASSDHLSTSASFAGVWAPEAERGSVFRSMQARRTFGATAPITLEFRAGEAWMGERLQVREAPPLRFSARGTAPFAYADVIVDGELFHRFEAAAEALEFTREFRLGAFGSGEHWVYVHLVQTDGEHAWASPIWIELS